MKKELELVEEFHKKFDYTLNDAPTLIDKDEAVIRHKIMKEEVEEYLDGAKNDDLPNIVKELCDILYTTYGTIVAHGLQDVAEEVFTEVHRSNMSKDSGEIKPKKGSKYSEPNLGKFFGEK